MNTPASTAPIVVGVDGSASSLEALRKAAELAASLNTCLQVITCWEAPQFYAEYVQLDPKAFEHDAQACQDAAISAVLGNEHPVRVDARLRRGRTAPELITASTDAQLLVLGTRGHGEFVQLLLGSVSLECITHAHCPVLTVRAPDTASH